MKGEMGSPGGEFLLRNNCSEPMHMATVLSFVISLKGNWVGGKPGKVFITKNHNQNFLSLSLDVSSEASICHVVPLPPRRQTCAFTALAVGSWLSLSVFKWSVSCLVFDSDQGSRRKELFLAENSDWKKREHENSIAEQHREIPQAH